MALLTLIVVQDLKARLVYWVCFPFLALALCLVHWLRSGSWRQLLFPIAFNTGIVMAMLLILTIYIWVTRKRLINIVADMLGWADILFLLSIGFYFSVPCFLVFYIVSLACSLVVWIVWQFFAERKSKQVPLAGFQSITLVLFLAGDWWLHLFNLTDDSWLFNLVNKWN